MDQLNIEFAFQIRIKVEAGKGLEVGSIPTGARGVIPIIGGSFEGPAIKGTIIPGGYDFQVLRTDAVLEIDARYVMQTDDGANITIVNKGLRHGPAEVMKQLADGVEVSPTDYYFRSVPVFETGNPKYQWLTRHVFIANGVRKPAEVIIRVFKVL